MAKRKRKSVTQQIMQEAIKILNKHQHDLTRQASPAFLVKYK